jgi:hypothetical protein
MMMRTLVLAVAVCFCPIARGSTAAAESAPAEHSLRRMVAGQQLEIRTSSRLYQVKLLDPLSGKASVRISTDEGRSFRSPQQVYLLGATPGRTPGQMLFTRSGVVRIGLKMELGIGSLDQKHRAFSRVVQSVRLR